MLPDMSLMSTIMSVVRLYTMLATKIQLLFERQIKYYMFLLLGLGSLSFNENLPIPRIN